MSYVVENIDFSKSPKDTFSFSENRSDKDKKPITYIEYYRRIKGERITEANQPLLKTSGRGGVAIYLIPELCLISELYVFVNFP